MTPRSVCYAVLAAIAFAVACLPGPFGPVVLMGATYLHLALRHGDARLGRAAVATLVALGPASVAAHAIAPLTPWGAVVAALAWSAPFGLVGLARPSRPWLAGLWTAFSWTAMEVAWGHVPVLGRLATPFLTIATAWVETPWIAMAAWTGSSGMTLVTLLVTGAWTASFRRPLHAVATSAVATIAATALTVVGMPYADTATGSAATQASTTTTVRIVQPNLSRQELAAMPWDAEALARYRTFLHDHLRSVSDADGWVAPESTIPWPLPRNGDAVEAGAWAEVLPFRGVGWFGSPTRDVGGHTRNGVVVWRDGVGTVVADKIVRVPWLEDALTPGEPREPTASLGLDAVRPVALVCFEVAFPHVVRQAFERGATALIVVANDAYAGRTPLASLHLRIARLRAAEVGLPLLFVQNTGPSAAVSANGTVTGAMPAGARGSMLVSFDTQPLARAPRRHGDVVGPASWIVTLLVLVARSLRSIVDRSVGRSPVITRRWREGVRPLVTDTGGGSTSA